MHISRKHKLAALRFAEGDAGAGGSGTGAGGNGGDGAGKPAAGGDAGKGSGDNGDRGSGDEGGDRLPKTEEEFNRIIQARLARDRKDRPSDEELTVLRQKAERADQLERERMSDQEKAVAEAVEAAKKEAADATRAELLPKLQTTQLRAAAAEILSGDRLDNWLKSVNVSAFVDEQGTVNTDEVVGTLTALFGDSDARGGDRRNNGGHIDWGHSRSGSGGGVAGGVEAGRELYKSRFK